MKDDADHLENIVNNIDQLRIITSNYKKFSEKLAGNKLLTNGTSHFPLIVSKREEILSKRSKVNEDSIVVFIHRSVFTKMMFHRKEIF